MEKEVIMPSSWPSWLKELGVPYSPAIKVGNVIFVSGCPGSRDRKTGQEITEVEAQTREALEMIKDILKEAGSSLEKVVKATMFLKDANDFATVNEVYRSYFPQNPPARTAIVTDMVLPGMLVEVECMAVM